MQQIKTKPLFPSQTKVKSPMLEKSTTKDTHEALFGNEDTQSAPPKTLQELKQGIEQYMQNKHPRR